MFNAFFDRVLFSFGSAQLTIGNLLLWFLLCLLLLACFFYLKRKWIPAVLHKREIEESEITRLYRLLTITLLCALLFLSIFFSGFDFDLTPKSNLDFKISYFVLSIVIFQIARLFNWFASHVFIHDAFVPKPIESQEAENPMGVQTEQRVSRIGRLFIFSVAANLLIQVLHLDFTLFSRTLSNGLVFDFKLSNILVVLLIIFGTQLLIWMVTQIVLRNIYLRNNFDVGASFAISQIFKYIVWTFAVFFGLDALGIDVTLLLGGAAALLVGIGLGLQSTFNDFISGIVLLFERSVKVGDMVETNGMIGRVKKIGMRSSIVEIRDATSVIVPNSLLVSQVVNNWTYDSDKTRFSISVGVSYGTDTALVKRLLLQITSTNPYIINYPPPFVRFENFGESSLDFTLYFFSRNYIVIEDIKSDLRFAIDEAFREHNIQIPFPQRDMNIKFDDSFDRDALKERL